MAEELKGGATMNRSIGKVLSVAIGTVALSAVQLSSALARVPGTPVVDDVGTITGTMARVPELSFLSAEDKGRLTELLQMTGQPSMADGIEAARDFSAQRAKESLDQWLEIYPASIDETSIDGAAVDIVTPNGGIASGNEKRVLINTHMGGFFTGGECGGQLEAVPLAGRGGVKVYAVDYRMSPEHIFPAASEDMEAIYRHVLETTPPENVGIYCCSAGGTLTGQMIPWSLEKNLPLPGAISIQCSGIMNTFWFGGGSRADQHASQRPLSRSNYTP
jgi:acetyl esterase/lipase